MIRVGQGFDVHRHSDDPDRMLVLGGCRFEGERGLAGHSDADVPAHAAADALLGAAGLGDIGRHFPDTDPRWAGADSLTILAGTADMVRAGGWTIGNVDVKVVCERPQLAPRKDEMEGNLSRAVGAPVTLSGRRAEGLGALGRQEGIAAWAVAVITREPELRWPPNAPAARPGGAPVKGAAVAPPPVAVDRERRRAAGPVARGPSGGDGDAPPRKVEKGLGGEQVEGRQAVRELLLAQRRRVFEIWISADLKETDAVDDIEAIAAANRVPISYVARRRLEAEARSEAPQGVLAKAAPIPEADLGPFLRKRRTTQPFIVAVDGVTDPGNLGAIVRSCDGAGVDVVVVPRHRAVHVTPTVAKASAGAVEHVPIAVVSGLPTMLQRCRDAGIWVIGLDDAADKSLFELGDLAVEGVCLVLGAEGAGLSRLVRERCDLIVSIPMKGRLSSLNVSAAAALATYEISRHR